MTTTSKLTKGVSVLTLSYSLSYLLSFIRNILIARIIGPTNFGIASLFLMTILFLDMISNINIDKLIVQSERGNEPLFLDTAHSIQGIRGVVTAALLFLLSTPLSSFFNVEEARWGFQFVALIPLLRGFAHLDVKRFHREMNYTPDCLVEVAYQFASLIVASCLAWFYRDYAIMVWALVAQSFVWTTATHLLAKRPYRLRWQKKIASLFFHFGWPLLINGLLMFGIFHGDRFLIGKFLGMEQLGLYGAAIGLTLVPQMMFSRIATSLLLPIFSKLRNNQQKLVQKYTQYMQKICILSICFAVCGSIAGPLIITIVYGIEFQQAGFLISWLAIASGLSLMRVIPTLIALSRGDSSTPMLSNFYRISSLALVYIAVMHNSDAIWAAYCAILGETIALFFLFNRTQKQYHLPINTGLVAFFWYGGSVIVIKTAVYVFPLQGVLPVSMALLATLLLTGGLLLKYPQQ